MNPLTPRGFLLYGGIILVVVALGGYLGIIGPTWDKSLFGSMWYFTDLENHAHLLFGIVALIAYYALKDANMTKWLVVLVGIVSALAVVVGIMIAGNPAPNATVSGITGDLESPMDTILHIVVALWAFAAAFMGSKKAVTS